MARRREIEEQQKLFQELSLKHEKLETENSAAAEEMRKLTDDFSARAIDMQSANAKAEQMAMDATEEIRTLKEENRYLKRALAVLEEQGK